MSLRWYRRPRMLVLGPGNSSLEAARAIEENRVGAVVVQDSGRIVGITTDRDLMVRVVGRGRDPATTRLGEIMTTDVVTLSPADSHADAIRVMRERNIRRVPLAENGAVVGMVTLDDLLLDEGASLEELAAVVQAQLGDGGPADSKRLPASRRSSARARGTLGRMLGQVRSRGEFGGPEHAENVLRITLSALVRRLDPGEAKDLVSQLPSLLKPALKRLPPGPDKSITRDSIVAELSRELGVDERAASQALRAVGAVVAESVSDGQMDDVRGQLPVDLRAVFELPEPA